MQATAILPIYYATGLPDVGVLVRIDGEPVVIMVAEGLPASFERCVIAHEQVHAADPYPTHDLPDDLQGHNEEQTDRAAARGLIDPVHLRRWITQALAAGEPVDLYNVAAEFDVTPRYAALALAQLDPPPIAWRDVPERAAEADAWLALDQARRAGQAFVAMDGW